MRAQCGALLEFVYATVANPPGTCVLWPFGGSKNLPPRMKYQGKSQSAHRLALILFKGDCPEKLALHTCADHQCINPRHLYWGSPMDNAIDRANDGRTAQGVEHYHAKLTESQVRFIRKDPRPHHKIATAYNVNRSTIGKIKRRESWRGLDD